MGNELDLRKTNIDVFTENNRRYVRYVLSFTIDDREVGELIFNSYSQIKLLDVDGISIEIKYQNLGIGTTLYKKFGELYNENFNGWRVKRFFVNPIAEYSFRKAVSLGWVPAAALNENLIKRDYLDSDFAKDLRNKLPKNIRGPEVWAKIISK